MAEQSQFEKAQARATIGRMIESQIDLPDGHRVEVLGCEILWDIQRAVFTYSIIKKFG